MSEHAIRPGDHPRSGRPDTEPTPEERADYKMGVDVSLILGATAIVFLAVILWFAL